jgi:hypothetical protein
MEVMTSLIEYGLKAGEGDFELVEYEPRNLILGSENVHQDASTFYPAWLTFMNSAKKAGLNIRYPVGGYFDSIERFKENPNMPSRFYFVNPHGKDVRSGGLWLAGYVRGFYGQTGDFLERMLAYIETNDIKVTGPVYNTFLLDEVSTVDQEQYLLRASIKVVE